MYIFNFRKRKVDSFFRCIDFFLKNNQSSSVMAIVFFNPISEVFPRKLTNATYPDVKIEVCVDNIGEFLSIIMT